MTSRTFLFPLLVAAVLCSPACVSPPIEECVGSALVTVEFDGPPPNNLVVVFNGRMLMDSCAEFDVGSVTRFSRAVIVDDGGFGYTPPREFDLEIWDQGDCATDEVELLSVEAYPLATDPQVCESYSTLIFAESA